jgi:hypothetical protein
LRCRVRAFVGAALVGAALVGAALVGAALADAAFGGAALAAALRGGGLGVAAPLSGRLPAPRVVLLLVVMTSPEESAHRMGLDKLRWK